MTDKRIWLGILALVFGFTMPGCASKPAISGNGLFEYTLSGIGVKGATITNYIGTKNEVTLQQIDGYSL